MILDAHMHLGEDLIFGTDDSPADLLAYMNEHGIDAALLQTGILPADPRAATQRLYALTRQYPGKFFGAAVLSPYTPQAQYEAFMRWAVCDLGFKALKLQGFAFCAAPSSPQARKIFDTADQLGVPVIIHTGNGVPTALPSLAIPIARDFPRLKIILAHAGGGMYGAEALVAAQTCENIFLETSWCTVLDLKNFVQTLGCTRLMFGTDVPLNAGVELAKYRALRLSDRQYEQCFYGTAAAVLNL